MFDNLPTREGFERQSVTKYTERTTHVSQKDSRAEKDVNQDSGASIGDREKEEEQQLGKDEDLGETVWHRDMTMATVCFLTWKITARKSKMMTGYVSMLIVSSKGYGRLPQV